LIVKVVFGHALFKNVISMSFFLIRSYNMTDASEDDDVILAQIAKRPKPSAQNLSLTENGEDKGNADESNGDAGVHDEDTVSSDEGETDMAKKKARIELFWKTKHTKEAEVDAKWAAT